MMNKSIIILIIIVLIICLCLLLYLKFNNKHNKITAGFISFYKSGPELIVISNYLSNVFYLIWLVKKYPKECFNSNFGEYALNLIYPYTHIIKTNSEYYNKLYNEIPLHNQNLKECYEKTLEKLNKAINKKDVKEIILLLRTDCLTYYLYNINIEDKEKIYQYINDYSNIISLYLNRILNNQNFENKIIALETPPNTDELIKLLSSKCIINEKVVIYITIFTEFMLKMLIIKKIVNS